MGFPYIILIKRIIRTINPTNPQKQPSEKRLIIIFHINPRSPNNSFTKTTKRVVMIITRMIKNTIPIINKTIISHTFLYFFH